MTEKLTSGTLHPKFMSVIKQLHIIQENNIKCKVFINFGGEDDIVNFRYEQINPEELNKLAHIISKGDNDTV